MRSTLMCMNVISETHDIFMVTSCILHGYFNCDVIHFSISVDWRIKNDILVFIDILNVTRNPTFVVVVSCLFKSLTFVSDRDLKATVQKGEFLDPLV